MDPFDTLFKGKLTRGEIVDEAKKILGTDSITGIDEFAFVYVAIKKVLDRVEELENRLAAIESHQGNLPDKLKD